MRAMIASDFVTMKGSFGQFALICAIVAVVMVVMSGSLVVSIAAICAMVPLMYAFTISAYDELNGWERFRLTLPISRAQVAYGRYASVFAMVVICDVAAALFSLVVMGVMSVAPPDMQVLGLMASENPPSVIFGVISCASALILFVAALTLPLFMRFGMTKGTRLVPVILVLLLALGPWLASESGLLTMSLPGGLGTLEEMFAHIGGPFVVVGIIIASAAVVVFFLSALLSARLYRARQF